MLQHAFQNVWQTSLLRQLRITSNSTSVKFNSSPSWVKTALTWLDPTGQTTRPSKSTSLHYISWPAGTAITDSKQSPHSEVATLLCFSTSVVERTPDQSQKSGITLHLPQKTQDSFDQTSPRPCIAEKKKKKYMHFMFVSLAL